MLAVIGLDAAPARADSNRCVSINGVLNGGFLADPNVSAGFTGPEMDANNNSTFTYTLTTPNETPYDGVPGLISYCVYPAQPPGNPNSMTTGTAFVASDNPVGSFSWSRTNGNPTNLSFDGTVYTMGTATWNAASCSTAPCPAVFPASQTILLHINDPVECSNLYGNGVANSVETCWVFPKGTSVGPPTSCNGAPACKSADITDADDNAYGSTTSLCRRIRSSSSTTATRL
jgi:hypothetical protein